jgi:chromosome segregation ATPase
MRSENKEETKNSAGEKTGTSKADTQGQTEGHKETIGHPDKITENQKFLSKKEKNKQKKKSKKDQSRVSGPESQPISVTTDQKLSTPLDAPQLKINQERQIIQNNPSQPSNEDLQQGIKEEIFKDLENDCQVNERPTKNKHEGSIPYQDEKADIVESVTKQKDQLQVLVTIETSTVNDQNEPKTTTMNQSSDDKPRNQKNGEDLLIFDATEKPLSQEKEKQSSAHDDSKNITAENTEKLIELEKMLEKLPSECLDKYLIETVADLKISIDSPFVLSHKIDPDQEPRLIKLELKEGEKELLDKTLGSAKDLALCFNEILSVMCEDRKKTVGQLTETKDQIEKLLAEKISISSELSTLQGDHNTLKCDYEITKAKYENLEASVTSIYDIADPRKKGADLQSMLSKLEKLAKDVNRQLRLDSEAGNGIDRQIIENVINDEKLMQTAGSEIEKILSRKPKPISEKNKQAFEKLKSKISASELIHFSKSDAGLCEISSCLNSIRQELMDKRKDLLEKSPSGVDFGRLDNCFEVIGLSLESVLETRLSDSKNELTKIIEAKGNNLEGTLYKPEVEKLQKKLEQLEKEKKDTEERLASSEKALAIAREEIKTLSESLSRLKAEFDKIEKESGSQKNKIEQLSDTIHTNESEMKSKDKTIEESVKVFSSLQNESSSKIQKIECEKFDYLRKVASLDRENEGLKERIRNLENSCKDLEYTLKHKLNIIATLEEKGKQGEDRVLDISVREGQSKVLSKCRTPNRSFVILEEGKADHNQSMLDAQNESFTQRKNEIGLMIQNFERKRKDYEEYKQVQDLQLNERRKQLAEGEREKDAKIVALEHSVRALKDAQKTFPKAADTKSLNYLVIGLPVSLLIIALLIKTFSHTS